MRKTASIVVGVGGTLLAGAALVAAFHTQFAFRVDRFEADGNSFGPADGIVDFVDEFDDGTIGPYWYRAYGTVTESNGHLVVQSPGVHFPAPPDPTSATGALLDLSIAGSSSPTWVTDGGGNFTATAYWEGVVPLPGNHYHFSVYTFNPTGGGIFAETFGLAIRNIGTAVEMEQHLTEIDQWTGTFQNTQLLFHAIDPADVTGRLGFRIMFDDATNVATTAFSLNDGATWQSPFPGGSIFQGRSTAQFLLSGDPVAGAVVTTTSTTISTSTTTSTLPGGPCVATGCRLSTEFFRSKLVLKDKLTDTADLLSWKWKKGEATSYQALGTPYNGTTYWFCLGNGAGQNIFEVEIPESFSNWTSTGRGHTFTDASGANGGVRKLILRSGPDGQASIVLKAQGLNLTLPDMPLQIPVTARLSNSYGECWAETFSIVGLGKNDDVQFVGKSGTP